MGETEQSIIRYLRDNPGISDKELAEAVKGPGKSPHYVNQQCRELANQNIILRRVRKDGLIGNWLYPDPDLIPVEIMSKTDSNDDEISEKKMKQILETYLTERRWEVKIAWGTNHGVDIEAVSGPAKWIIEVKGAGAYSPMRSNYFYSILGETLKRMDDPDCKYSIALPEIDQFKRLWERLPDLAKARTGITALFVGSNGKVTEKTS